MNNILIKGKITDYEGSGEYWVRVADNENSQIMDESDLVSIKEGYKVKMLCFDNADGVTPYEEEPAINPIHESKEKAFMYARTLAEQECKELNEAETTVKGYSYMIPEDEEYKEENSIAVMQYCDAKKESSQLTVYFLEKVKYALIEDDE